MWTPRSFLKFQAAFQRFSGLLLGTLVVSVAEHLAFQTFFYYATDDSPQKSSTFFHGGWLSEL